MKKEDEQAVCNQKEALNRVAMVSQSRAAKRCVRLKTLPPGFTNDQLPKAAFGGEGWSSYPARPMISTNILQIDHDRSLTGRRMTVKT